MPITLAAAQIETQTVGGATIDTANAACATNIHSNFAGVMEFTIAKGSPASNAFTGSPVARDISVSVNLVTGDWTASNGQRGTLSSAALTSVLNQLRSFRNQIESFTSNQILVGSSVVAWT